MKPQSVAGHDLGNEIRAVVRIEEAAYKELARWGKVWEILPWQDYCAFVEKCIQEGVDRNRQVKVYEGDNIRISAFLHAKGCDFNTASALAYADDLLRREAGENHVVDR